MNFEVGHHWLTRNGEIVEIIRFDNARYPIVGEFISRPQDKRHCGGWYKTGRYDLNKESGNDLIKQISKRKNPELYL